MSTYNPDRINVDSPDGWHTVHSRVQKLIDAILVEENCIKLTNGITIDTYVPTVHIDNLRNAMAEAYIYGCEHTNEFYNKFAEEINKELHKLPI